MRGEGGGDGRGRKASSQRHEVRRKKVTKPELDAFEMVKAQEERPKINDLKPGGIRLQTEPGERQKARLSSLPRHQLDQAPPGAQSSRGRRAWGVLLHSQSGERAGAGAGAVRSSKLEVKLKLAAWCPHPATPEREQYRLRGEGLHPGQSGVQKSAS